MKKNICFFFLLSLEEAISNIISVKVSPPRHPSYIIDGDDDLSLQLPPHTSATLTTSSSSSSTGMYETTPLAYKKSSSVYKENINTQSHFVSSESLGNNAGAILVIFLRFFTIFILHNTLH